MSSRLTLRCYVRATLVKWLCAISVLTLGVSSAAHAFEVSYGGRLVHQDGRPLDGPASITLHFYDAPSGGTPKYSREFPSVTLAEGMFQVSIPIDGTEIGGLLGDGTLALYVEVVSQGVTYPRQKFVYAPLALRVPIDESTLAYNASGKLTIKNPVASAIPPLIATPPLDFDRNTGTISLAYVPVRKSGDTMSGALSMGSSKITNLATPTDPNDAVTKAYADQKVAGYAHSLTGLTAQDDGKVLKYAGGAFFLGSVSLGAGVSGTVAIAHGGTGATSAQDAFDALSPLTSVGDLLVAGASGVDTRLPGNATATRQFLQSVGTGTQATLPSWGSLAATDIPDLSADKITSGILSNDRINWSAPGALGTTTPSIGKFTSITAAGETGVAFTAFDTIGGSTSPIRFYELEANGSDYVGFKAPDNVQSQLTWILPDRDGEAGHVLTTDGSGRLSWTPASSGSGGGGGSPTGAAGGDLASIYPNPTVATVGGLGASLVASGANLANGATATNTASKIVKRDANGDFAAGTITASAFIGSLTGNATNVTGTVAIANGGTGATTAADARANLGLGTAATLQAGVAAQNLVQLDGSAKLPAVDGTQITGVIKTAGDTMTGALNLPSNGLAVGTNQLVVSGGNVGIGTSNPQGSLEIASSSNSHVIITGSDLATFTIGTEGNGNKQSTINLVTKGKNPIGAAATKGWHIYARGDEWGSSQGNDLGFSFYNGTVGTGVLHMTDDGNVGIGSTTPSARLDVSGESRVGAAPATLTTVSGAHTNAVTTITVVSTTGYPSSGTLLINGEAISYTGTTATTFTGCTRGVLGTTTVAFVGGETVDTYLSVVRTSATAPRMVTTAAGNVGIGTTSAATKLEVNGPLANNTVGVSDILTLHRFGTTNLSWDQWAVFSLGRYATTDWQNRPFSRLDIKLNDTSQSTSASTAAAVMTLQGNGNVGIGTTSPATLLHVRGAGADTATYNSLRLDNPAAGNTAGTTNGLLFYWNTMDAARVASVLETGGSPWPTSLAFYTAPNSSGTTEKMRIMSNGNVGIGTTSPGAQLEVLGPAVTWGDNRFNIVALDSSSMAANVGGGIGFGGYYTTTNTVAEWAGIKSYKVNATSGDAAGGLVFSTRAQGASTAERMRIDNNGNVGIGTTAPSAKLQVSGQFVTTLPATLTPSTSQTIDWSTGNIQTVSLASATGNVTLTFTNAVAGAALAVKVVQGSTPYNIVWPASVKWPNGLVPTISTGSGAIDMITFFYDGTNYFAAAGQNYQ